jgi:hypothetical protein
MGRKPASQPEHDDTFVKRVKVKLRPDPMPAPIFANHIEAMGGEDEMTLTFYAAVFPRAYAPGNVPDEMEGRVVAQIVVPGGVWIELLNKIYAKRERTARQRGGKAHGE